MQRIMIRNALMLCLLLEWGAFAFIIQSQKQVVGQETSKNTIVDVSVVDLRYCKGEALYAAKLLIKKKSNKETGFTVIFYT